MILDPFIKANIPKHKIFQPVYPEVKNTKTQIPLKFWPHSSDSTIIWLPLKHTETLTDTTNFRSLSFLKVRIFMKQQ